MFGREEREGQMGEAYAAADQVAQLPDPTRLTVLLASGVTPEELPDSLQLLHATAFPNGITVESLKDPVIQDYLASVHATLPDTQG